jgi:hypothetical protein
MAVVSPPICLPAAAWRSPEAQAALLGRDVAGLLRIAQQHGASQSRIAAAMGWGQGRANEMVNGRRTVTTLEMFERVADGLALPDEARIRLGLAPRHPAGLDHLSPAGRAEILKVFPFQSAAVADIRDQARTATSFDVLAVRALGIIGMNDSLLRGPASSAGATVRVLLLDPDSPAAVRRAEEIGESVPSFTEGIRLSVTRLCELADRTGAEVAVWLYDQLPTWRVIGVDQVLYVSAFGPGREGHHSAVYKIAQTAHGALHPGFHRQFTELAASATRAV